MHRHERHRSGGGAFVCGLMTGATLGAVVAMLFAPKAGSDMRRDLTDEVADLGQAAKDRWGDVTAAAVDKGREALDHARRTAQDLADSASGAVDRVKGAGKNTANDAGASRSA